LTFTRRDGVLLVAVLLAALSLRLLLISRHSLDLMPRPDALEYSAMAHGLATGSGLTFELDGQAYPSRYPYGTALVLWPAVALAGGDPAYGFISILLLALLCVALTYLLARQLVGPAAALLAATIVMICPRHATLSTLPMSEVPSTALVLVLVFAQLKWWQGRRQARWLLPLGFAAASVASIRWPNLLVLTPLVWMLLVGDSCRGRRGLLLGLLVLGVVLGLLPEWIYRAELFGSPFQTGYHYWEPDEYASWQTSYNPRFLFEPPRPGWVFSNLELYARGLSGYRPALWTPVTAALALLGALLCWRRRRQPVVPILYLVPLSGVAFYLCYFFRDQRMNVVAVPYIATLAACTFDTLWRRLSSAGGRLLLAAVTLVGVTWGAGLEATLQPDTPLYERGVLGELLRNEEAARKTRKHILHSHLKQAGAGVDPSTVIVADLALLHLQPYLPEGVEIIALSHQPEEGSLRVDEEVRLIYHHQLRTLAGEYRPPRALFRGEQLCEPVLEELRQMQREGRPIELWVRPHKTPFYRYAPVMTAKFDPLQPVTEALDSTAPLQRAHLRLKQP
jgi:4-amino-4-deoxy-L-arabinose transferase-like glycosyltransferase